MFSKKLVKLNFSKEYFCKNISLINCSVLVHVYIDFIV